MNELFVLADNRYNHTTAPFHTAISGTAECTNAHAVLWRGYVLPTGADIYQPSQITEPNSVDITLAGEK